MIRAGCKVQHKLREDLQGEVTALGEDRFAGQAKVRWNDSNLESFHPISLLATADPSKLPAKKKRLRTEREVEPEEIEEEDSGVTEIELASERPTDYEVEPDAHHTEFVPTDAPEEGATVQD